MMALSIRERCTGLCAVEPIRLGSLKLLPAVGIGSSGKLFEAPSSFSKLRSTKALSV